MDQRYFVVPKEPTRNKEELIRFVAVLFAEDVLHVDGREGLRLLQSYNNSTLRQLHDLALKEYDYIVSNFIKKSIKLCYGGSRLFGVSSIEMNNYITDLRIAIKNY
nr:hypothetical protein [Lysinibacillus timonensis]